MSPNLDAPTWRGLEAAHEARVDTLTAGHRARRADGRRHPVEDFLFVYYDNSPARLSRWHPGPGVVLDDAARMPRAAWRFYRATPGGGVELDVAAFLDSRAQTVALVRRLLSETLRRPAHLGCFGLHEWAMVHRSPPEQVRHRDWPLRLGADGTDEVTETHRIRCSHFDAVRFFTPSAAPLNALSPTRATQAQMEQPGCLHAGMDLYKWSFKLAPAVPSELIADCFALAREIREVDMRASPYDLTDLGYAPIAIETPSGKADYVAAQRSFAERANILRARLLRALDDAERSLSAIGSSPRPTGRERGRVQHITGQASPWPR